MRVLHINQSDKQGGAAIAAYRLHTELLSQSANSRLVVRRPVTGAQEVRSIGFRRIPDGLLAKASSIIGLNNILTFRSYRLLRSDWYQEADVLNLHNLHPGYFNHLFLPALTKSKPAVHTLHDMWAITGHCAYSYDCNRWQTGCGKCPYKTAYPEISIDSTRLALKMKSWAYRNSNIRLVAPSRWLMGLLEKSVLSDIPRHYIPNGIDLETYKPMDQALAREILGLPEKSLVVMFAAESLADQRKGAGYLKKIFTSLPSAFRKQMVLLTLGRGTMQSTELGIETHSLGYVDNDRFKAIAYNAADLFVFTSIQDNLPLVLQESMGCGVPMVAFDAGGVSDIVRDGETGSLVSSGDTAAFSNRIQVLLEDTGAREMMKTACRKIALAEYDISLQARRYLELYRQAQAEMR